MSESEFGLSTHGSHDNEMEVEVMDVLTGVLGRSTTEENNRSNIEPMRRVGWLY